MREENEGGPEPCTSTLQAAWKGHREALEWMLRTDAGPQLRYQLLLPAADGRLPVDKAAVNGHGAIARWLRGLMQSQPPSASANPDSSRQAEGPLHKDD